MADRLTNLKNVRDRIEDIMRNSLNAGTLEADLYYLWQETSDYVKSEEDNKKSKKVIVEPPMALENEVKKNADKIRKELNEVHK